MRHLDILCRRDKHPVPVVVCLPEDGVEVLQPLHDPDGHLASVGRLVRARVQGGAEALADLLHAGLELLALEEDDEHRLQNLEGQKRGNELFRLNFPNKQTTTSLI